MLAEREFAGIETILHAGDVVNPDVLLAFADRTVHVVRGNMDPAVSGIPSRKIIEIGGFRIGLPCRSGARQPSHRTTGTA